MATILFLLLAVCEISLAVYSVIRKILKKDWSRLRLITNAGELALFCVMLLLPGIDAGFRFKGLIVLLVLRAALSAASYLIKKKRYQGRKKISSIVVSCILSIILLLGATVPAFIFADYNGRPTSGEYTVASTSAILVDSSRVEEFESDGSFREVPVYFFYPEELDSVADNTLPLVFFSHGAFGYYQSNASTYMELASNGYLVISIEHPYHSFFTMDTDGKTVTVDPEFITTAMTVGNEQTEEESYQTTRPWIQLRLDDMNFAVDAVKKAAATGSLDDSWFADDLTKETLLSVLSKADEDTIGLMGHSLGGAAAVTVGRNRGDISAVIDLDGTMLGENLGVENGITVVNSEPYPVPLLNVENEEHHQSRMENVKLGIPYSNTVVLENAVDGHNAYFVGSGHMNFTDLPLFSPFLASKLGTGSIDSAECVDTVNRLVLDFFDCYLKNKGGFVCEERYG